MSPSNALKHHETLPKTGSNLITLVTFALRPLPLTSKWKEGSDRREEVNVFRWWEASGSEFHSHPAHLERLPASDATNHVWLCQVMSPAASCGHQRGGVWTLVDE